VLGLCELTAVCVFTRLLVTTYCCVINFKSLIQYDILERLFFELGLLSLYLVVLTHA